MICQSCKAAGRLLVEARTEVLPANRTFMLDVATERHNDCEYPKQCTCQHKVFYERGKVIEGG